MTSREIQRVLDAISEIQGKGEPRVQPDQVPLIGRIVEALVHHDARLQALETKGA